MQEHGVVEKPVVERLELLLYQVIQHYERQVQDSQLMNKKRDDISKASQLLINEAAEKINHSVASMEAMANSIKREKNKLAWKMVVIAVGSSLLTSILLAWLIISKSTLPLTMKQINYLQDGKSLAGIWPKLSKQEKEHLKTISNETQKGY